MKKKLNIAEVIMAIIFIAASASARTAIVQKEPPEFYTTEYYELQTTFYDYPVFSMTRDENDNPKLVVEYKSFYSYTDILRVQLKDGKETMALAHLDGDAVKWKEIKGKHSFIVFECANGSMKGYFYYEFTLERGMGLPPAKCIMAGSLQGFKWDAKRNKYVAGSGSGKFAGGNEPQDFEAWNLAFPAAPITNDKILPVSGGSHVVPHTYLTEMQIRRTLQQSGRK